MYAQNLGSYCFGLISGDIRLADLEHRLPSYVVNSRRQAAAWRTAQPPLTVDDLIAFGCKCSSIVGYLQQAPGSSIIRLEDYADALA
jgi:hypothetical protein